MSERGYGCVRAGVSHPVRTAVLCSVAGQPSPSLTCRNPQSPHRCVSTGPTACVVCLPASLQPAGGEAARTAPGASGAARRLNPAPAAFREGTPASPAPVWPCLHLYRKAAPRLRSGKGDPRIQLAFNLFLRGTHHTSASVNPLPGWGPSHGFQGQVQGGHSQQRSVYVCLRACQCVSENVAGVLQPNAMPSSPN